MLISGSLLRVSPAVNIFQNFLVCSVKVASGSHGRLYPTRTFTMKTHVKARGEYYPRTDNSVKRFSIPDDKVNWDVKWAEYKPVEFTAKHILGQPWADPDLESPSFSPKWNAVDGKVDRLSHNGVYGFDGKFPLNPIGRTGITGRGILGRWGPNHAADPIVTRWKKIGKEVLMAADGKPVLQFVAIERRDSREWAIPGGMVDAGEKVSQTLQREFGEEALNSLEISDKEKAVFQKEVDEFFTKGDEVYKGYVDDPRNTDNAWMETVAVNFHDENGDVVARFPLVAGDDASNVRWTDITAKLELYASHVEFIEKVAKLRNAHW